MKVIATVKPQEIDEKAADVCMAAQHLHVALHNLAVILATSAMVDDCAHVVQQRKAIGRMIDMIERRYR